MVCYNVIQCNCMQWCTIINSHCCLSSWNLPGIYAPRCTVHPGLLHSDRIVGPGDRSKEEPGRCSIHVPHVPGHKSHAAVNLRCMTCASPMKQQPQKRCAAFQGPPRDFNFKTRIDKIQVKGWINILPLWWLSRHIKSAWTPQVQSSEH